VSQALAAIDGLRRAGALTVLCASLVEWQDGTLEVAPLPLEHADQIDVTAWRQLLAGTLQAPPPSSDAPDPTGSVAEPGLSESFLLEVGEALRTAPKALAFVVTGVDPGATVAALRHLPQTKLVYGALPPQVLRRLLAHNRRIK